MMFINYLMNSLYFFYSCLYMLLVRNIDRASFVSIILLGLNFRCDAISDYMVCVEVVIFLVLFFFRWFSKYVV